MIKTIENQTTTRLSLREHTELKDIDLQITVHGNDRKYGHLPWNIEQLVDLIN